MKIFHTSFRFNIGFLAISRAKLPNDISRAKLPNAISRAKLPNAISRAKLSNAISRAKLSNAISRAKLPNAISRAKFPNTISRVKFRNLTRVISDESGSAVVEFVLLAVPLLIPIVIYLGAVRENSSINSDLHNLARQSARAFITSSSESFESARLQSVLQTFETRVFQAHGVVEIPVVSVECSASPCLTPDSRVKVTASLEIYHKNLSGIFRFISAPVQQFSASDVQIVDAWR